MRPCHCELQTTGQPYDIKTMCRKCWLYHNDRAYHQAWKEGEPEPPVPKKRMTGRVGKPCNCGKK